MTAEKQQEHERRRKLLEQAAKKKQRLGKHTNFVVQDQTADQEMEQTRQATDNVQVVVLGRQQQQQQQQSQSSQGTRSDNDHVTRAIYSRSLLVNGHDDATGATSSSSGSKKRRNSKPTTAEQDGSWKRSKKMNRLLAPGVKSQRKKGRSTAAAKFV